MVMIFRRRQFSSRSPPAFRCEDGNRKRLQAAGFQEKSLFMMRLPCAGMGTRIVRISRKRIFCGPVPKALVQPSLVNKNLFT